MNYVELLAPAKDFETAVAAIEAGADALYMGGPRFGARQAAGNSLEEIARTVAYAHQFGVRVHVTINTLLYDEELTEAEAQARALIGVGVDALIVQDMALRRMNLPVELHASTQVNNMTPEGARFLGEVGFRRVILERSLSLEEIRAIRQATDAELECFVHGAICVGYSGRCFLSRSMTSDRSGNRGACSQPCRLTYDLINERGERLLTGKHLLSVRDLNLTARLGELMDAGICSFKIEGRLKDITYVRNVVAWYRAAIDRELSQRPHLRRASVGRSLPDFTPDPAKSFTRGFSEYLYGGKVAGLASFDTPKAVGEFIGRVKSIGRQDLLLDRPHTLESGDGICFAGRGTNINRVEGARIFPNRMEGLAIGMEIYRNFDRKFTQAVERSRLRRVIPTVAAVEITATTLRLRYRDCEGVEAEVVRSGEFSEAQQPEKMRSTLQTQLQRSGDTIFAVEAVQVVGEPRFVPASLLSEVRREALERLLQQRLARPLTHDIRPENPLPRYPKQHLSAQENVTNRLAEAFYRDHGVEQIERGLDLHPSMQGRVVMRSGYCLRRELGQCLRQNPTWREELYLQHGPFRYRLHFDCRQCEMSLVDESRS